MVCIRLQYATQQFICMCAFLSPTPYHITHSVYPNQPQSGNFSMLNHIPLQQLPQQHQQHPHSAAQPPHLYQVRNKICETVLCFMYFMQFFLLFLVIIVICSSYSSFYFFSLSPFSFSHDMFN